MLNIIKQQNQKGFTLIELLVVIAIIGILAGILFVAINPKEQTDKAMDAKRIVAINQIQKALERYNLDHGYYPKLKVHTAGVNGANKAAFETALAPYISIDLDDKIFGPKVKTGDAEFEYKSTGDTNYQSYGMMITLLSDSNHNLELNDGGWYSNWYEVGENPSYCIKTYGHGNAGDWWSTSNRCNGGS